MSRRALSELSALARRHARRAHEADDLLQDALLAAVEAGRTDLSLPSNQRWLAGVMRNQGRMAARSAARRHTRETEWAETADPADAPHSAASADTLDILASLPPALRLTALLALNGATREEIRWLLGIPDTALRQRLAALKRALAALGVTLQPHATAPSGPMSSLALGRIRQALLGPVHRRDGALLASHDPDGNLFLVTRSQTGAPRQRTPG